MLVSKINTFIRSNATNKHLRHFLDTATSKQIHDRVGALMPEYDLTRNGLRHSPKNNNKTEADGQPLTSFDLKGRSKAPTARSSVRVGSIIHV